MSIYEVTFIVRAELAEKDAQAITKEVTEQFTKNGGKVHKEEYWGLRNFAYEIKKAKKGHYTHIIVEGSSEVLSEAERFMKFHENIVRSLTIKVDEVNKEPSAILNEEEEQDYKKAAAN